MAEWEVPALLASLHTWKDFIRQQKAQLIVQIDPKAALGIALRLASPIPLVNILAAEISLQLEASRANVLNGEMDALPRLKEGKSIPHRLAHQPKETAP